jgi:hypothetical protein
MSEKTISRYCPFKDCALLSAVTYFGGEVIPGVGGVEDGLHGEHIQLPGLQQWGVPALLQHVQAARQEHLTG